MNAEERIEELEATLARERSMHAEDRRVIAEQHQHIEGLLASQRETDEALNRIQQAAVKARSKALTARAKPHAYKHGVKAA